jgi:hypothetical protein
LRSILVLIFASVVVGGSAGGVLGVNAQHAEQLLAGILQDVGAILQSFEGGPDDPKSPVTNTSSLAEDQARLDAASQKASELATEMQKMQDGVAGRDRH